MDVDLGHLSKPCVCGRDHTIGVQEVVIEAGAVSRLDDILKENQFQNPVFICDSNTRAAAEPYLEEEFKDYLVIELDPEGLAADDSNVKKVLSQVDACDRGLSSVSVDALVAIGSGTIHDLTRFAADEYEIPFISIPTAASVDAYTSSVAMIRKGRLNRFVPACAPRWVLADTTVFRNAPYRLTASGISEVLGKYTAILDWKISHMITDEYFCERACIMVQDAIRHVEDVVDDIRQGDPEAYEVLMRALLTCGLTVDMIGSTRAVSGSEHYLGRLWTMGIFRCSKDTLHGERVSVAMLAVLRYYKKLAEDIHAGRVTMEDEAAKGMEIELLEDTFGEDELLENILTENEPNPLEEIDLEDLRDHLDEIADEIRKLPDPDKLADILKKGGCVTRPKEIGVSSKGLKKAIRIAPYLRNRITLLRLSKLFIRSR